MRVAKEHRGLGLGRRLVEHLEAEARQRNYQRLSLETGAMEFFRPARLLYQRCGFRECPPFGSYQEDVNSVFMTKFFDPCAP